MSKWLNVTLLLLASVGSSWLTVYLYQTDGDYLSRGVVTQVGPEVSFSQDKHGLLAQMSYTDLRGTEVAFKRYPSAKIVGLLRSQQPVYVEYIPGEWNSERFQGEDSGAWKWALASLAFIAALVWVVRTPGPVIEANPEPQRVSPLGWLMAWIIRGGVLMMALGGLVAGVAGLFGGHAGTQDVVLLGVGLAFAGLFVVSLRMRLVG